LLVLLVALALAFGLGVARLFQLRFEAGDLYPPYSSLRADPLGTRAFFEALKGLEEISVQRFTSPLNKLPVGRDTTLLVLGGAPQSMEESTEDEYTKLERFMSDGGRIVISLSPVNSRPWNIDPREASEVKKQKTKSRRAPPDKKENSGDSDKTDADSSHPNARPEDGDKGVPGERMIALKQRWGVEFGYAELPKNPDGGFRSVEARTESDPDLPSPVLWHTALYFDNTPTNWNVLYSREKHPVIIERRFGRGTLVFSADSYFLSNEALLKNRYPRLLAWAVGPNTRVIFDETHLGVIEEPGVAALIRRYHLHGFVAGLLLLAGLFVWRNTTAFNPARPAAGGRFSADSIVGRDSLAGFVNLLCRGIPPANVLFLCFTEWKKARNPGALNSKTRVERVTQVIELEKSAPASQRNPVDAFRRISQILAERS
jgi:hypothetical protein